MAQIREPGKQCPKYGECSVNNCPLHVDYPDLYADADDSEHECTVKNTVAKIRVNHAANQDIEHISVRFASPEDLRKWVQAVTRSGDAPRYNYPGWPADLWSKSAVEILDYLEDRFRETEDVQEYYSCILYLRTKVDAEELYMLWKDSPNFKAIQAKQSVENSQVNTKVWGKNTARAYAANHTRRAARHISGMR